MKQRNSGKKFFRQAVFERANPDDRTVELTISSEGTVVQRWYGGEILGHGPGEIRLERLKTVGSFLFAHGRDPNYGVLPIGSIVDVSLDETERKLRAVVKFDTDERSDVLFQKVQSGALRGVSIGYLVYKWLDVEAGETERGFTGPVSIAVDWEPYEISLEPTPADPAVGVGRSSDDINDNQQRSDDVMDKEEQVIDTPEDDTRTAIEAERKVIDTPEDDTRTAIKAERKRVAEIMSLCRQFNVDADEFIRSGVQVDAVRKAILEKLAEQNKPLTTARIVADEQEKFRSAAIDALAMRAGLRVEKPADGANELRGMKLLDLARECVERETGQRVRHYDEERLVRDAVTGTAGFPLILSNVANKSMSQAYQAAPTTFQAWTRRGSLSDFKAATRLRLSEADELLPMTELGEFKHAEITESGQTVQLGTYGRKFSISRKAIINDDLGALSTIPAKYGAAARRMINRMVYDIINNNTKLSDNVQLFHSNHGNLAASGAALSVTSLGAAVAAMRKQKNIGGKEYLNITPAYLLVPPELEVVAGQLISSIVDPSKSNATPNPFANRLQVIVDPQLSVNPTAWYLAAAPDVVDTIEVTYLNGQEAPTLEQRVSFDILGIEWRIYLDVGVTPLDYRGLFKNPGA